MIGIILTGHGSFPIGMLESAKLIVGEVNNIEAVPFYKDLEKFKSTMLKAIEKVDTDSGVVCFTDLPGGSTFNVCSKIALDRDNVIVIGGTNLPMLLSALFQRGLEMNEFIDKILSRGKNNIIAFEKK